MPEQGIIAEKKVKNAAGDDIGHSTTFPGDINSYTIRITAQALVDKIGPVVISDEISEYFEYIADYVFVTTKNNGSYEIMSSYSANVMTVSTNYSLTEESDWLEITFNGKVKEDAGGKVIYNQAMIRADGLPGHKETNITKVTVFSGAEEKVSEKSEAGIGGGGYDAGTHTVNWTLTDVSSQYAGKVPVVAVVNEKAVVKVENSATVQVGESEARDTNIVKNLAFQKAPEKKISETSEAGKGGNAVKAGDKITYDIAYLNYEETAATITITDRLPGSVDFGSVTDGGRYNEATHTVIWRLTGVPGGATGKVSVVATVNKKATVKIGNYATIQVGDNEALATNNVENPIKGSQCLNLKQVMKCRKTIKGRKIWIDNDNENSTRPPNVEIRLLRDGQLYKTITVDSEGDGAYIFVCLPTKKNFAHKYEYQVEEATIPAGYTKKIEGYNVINTLNP